MSQTIYVEGRGLLAYFPTTDSILRSDVKPGYTVINHELEGATYLIVANSYTLQVGDLTLYSGFKAKLLPADDGAWNVYWFGAKRDTNNQYLTFDLAAQRALQAVGISAGTLNTRGPVRVPVGNWTLAQQVPTEAVWLLDPGAEFTQPPNYLPSNTDNLEFLKGDVVKIGARGNNVLQLGSTDLDWVANNWRATSQGTAVVSAASRYGAVCYSAFTRSSDNPTGGEGTIGYQAYVANDNEVDLANTYCYFAATYRAPGAGTTFNTESNVTTIGTMKPVYPWGDYGGTYGATVNEWWGGPEGGIVGGYDDTQKAPTSAAGVVSPGLAVNPANGKKWGFDAGFVFLRVSFENGSKDIIRGFTGCNLAYWANSGDPVIIDTPNEDEANAGGGKYERKIRNAGTGGYTNYRQYADKFITTDNQCALGLATHRWTEVFAVNGSINTSDAREKTKPVDIEQALKDAALEVKGLIKKWKWLAAVEQKGDSARWHIGPIAQDVQAVFESHGVDPFEYGFLCEDDVVDDEGNKLGYTRLALRPTELQWLIMAAEL